MALIPAMRDPEDVVDAFFAAHGEPDDEARRSQLEESVSEDVEFHGLKVTLIGRSALEEGFRDAGSLNRTSGVEQRGEWLRWGWEFRGPDGEVPMVDGVAYQGAAVGRLSDDGRLALIVPFLGR